MVDRHEAGSRRKVMVVDLDGTIIKGNSLHEYIKAGLATAVRHARIDKALYLSGLLLLRRLRLIRHTTMKFASARIIGRNAEILTRLRDRVSQMRSQAMAQLIAEYEAQGCEVLVASAAFDFYIPYITEYPFIATAYDGNDERDELRGERKAQAVAKWLAVNNAELTAVATDHLDDTPLLQLPCPNRYIINPKTQIITRL